MAERLLDEDKVKMKQFLSKYQNPETTFNDIAGVLKIHQSLCWKIKPFEFNNGFQKLLIQLQGTIPVTFRCHIYHIPICIWVTDTHPNCTPICYVTPTPEMNIKVSNFIDHTGKIYLPYLHDWIPYKSNLAGLIEVMILLFGEQPPVFQKVNKCENLVFPHEVVQQTFPKQSTMPVLPKEYTPPMLLNVFPATDVTYPSFPLTGSTSNYPISSFTASFPPYAASPSISSSSSSCTGTITEEHIRASVLSAIGDKLRRRLREQFSQLQAELETLQRTQQELSSGSGRLTELFIKFQKEKSELEKNIKILKDKELELQKEITKLSDTQSINIDEAVTTIAPLYKQILNTFVEEAAIEDAIYYLAEGLRSSIIDLDAFLKQVRQLSRRQFMLRALMSLCRQKAGLAS